jgi:hypothetical protein
LPSFHWFTGHLLTELPRFREIYNRSLLEYRRLHRVRSRNHPAPELAAQDDWREAPFWIWSESDPRRRRLFVRPGGETITLSDRKALRIELPCGTRLAASLEELPRRGVKLRTRALITTLWARLALGDLFLHGIGGAKYDQLTDWIMQRFFGIAPPGFLTVTATLRLPIVPDARPHDEAREVHQRLRDVEFHPERWLGSAIEHPEVKQLVQSKAAWIAEGTAEHDARTRCRAIREINERLSQWTHAEREDLLKRRESALARQRTAAILGSREYAFFLFPEKSLRDFMLEFLAESPYLSANVTER